MIKRNYSVSSSFLRFLAVFGLVLMGTSGYAQLDSARQLLKGSAYQKAVGNLMMGTGFKDLARYDSALFYLKRASTLFKDSTNLAEVHYQTGEVYSLTKKDKEAIAAYQQALTIQNKIGNSNGAAKALIGLGYISLKTKKYPQAKQFYTQALQRAERNAAFEIMIDAYNGLIGVNAAQKDLRSELTNVRFMQGVYDSISNRERKRQLEEMEDKYAKQLEEKDSMLVRAEADHRQVQSDRLLRLIERDDIKTTFYSVAAAMAFIVVCLFAAWLITHRRMIIAETRLRREVAATKLTNEQFEVIARQLNIQLAARQGSIVDNMLDTVWLINPNNKSLESLIGYIRERTNTVLKQSGINYMLIMPDRIPNVQMTSLERVNLYFVTRELIDYAIESANGGGITLSITLERRQIIFKIKNSSPPNDDELKLYRERMEVINGTIGVINEQGAMVVIYRKDF